MSVHNNYCNLFIFEIILFLEVSQNRTNKGYHWNNIIKSSVLDDNIMHFVICKLFGLTLAISK